MWVDIQGWATQAFHSAPPALKYVEGVPLTAIGVWDTVGALGIPDYCARTQQRVNFTPTLWLTDPRVVQLLFCGADAPYRPVNLLNGYFKPDWSGPIDGVVVEP